VRGSEAIETAGDVLPRRWRRPLGLVALGLLVVTGKADEFFTWFVTDKAAAVEEAFVVPMMERIRENVGRMSVPEPG
jgi:hypothetical protein